MTKYLALEQLVALHIEIVCRKMGEPYLGMLNQGLLETALARPCHAANYERADILRQAAYLFHGLLMNHGFVQDNKRSAYVALEWFLAMNDAGSIVASDQEIIDMCLNAINSRWDVDQLEAWLRTHVQSR